MYYVKFYEIIVKGWLYVKRLQKNNRIENVRLEENTKHFIDGFKKLVEQNNQPTINRLIKFMANSVQGELISNVYIMIEIMPNTLGTLFIV